MPAVTTLLPSDALALFDAVVHGRPTLGRAALESFEVVAAPGATSERLRPGDLVVRRGLAEGGLAWVGTLADAELYPVEEARRLEFAVESDRPGLYARFLQPPARRIADVGGRVDHGHLIVRRASPRDTTAEAAPEDAAEEQARHDFLEHLHGQAQRRMTFVSDTVLTHAIDARATRPELRDLFDQTIALAAAARRLYDATTSPARYWHLVVAKGHIVVGASRIVALLERDRFVCGTAGNTVVVHADVVEGMRHTWRQTGETLTLGELCRGAPVRCPPLHDGLHPAGDAAHFVSLSSARIRVVELAGLFGLDLRGVPSADRPSTAAKRVRAAAPLESLSFVAIRAGAHREVHVGRQTPLRVESFVEGAPWRCLPFVAIPGTDYVLVKRRWWEASLHRQWGPTASIEWIVGLASFYRDRTGLRLGIGDISHVAGQDMTDHSSHEVGKDVDVYVVDDPPAGSTYPVMYWCSGTLAAPELRELVAPAAHAPSPEYAVPGGAAPAIAAPRSTTLLERYATIVAYCIATQPLVNAVVWHGARAVQARALAIAQQAWDDVVAAAQGTAARPGWRATWGPGPANRAAIVAPPLAKLIGAGAPATTYGAPGAGWPAHQDHAHIRLV